MTCVYFDNAATTKPLDDVIKIYCDMAQKQYGNPSSLHKMGINAENEIKKAASSLADLMGVSPDELLYTSGGTESNNLAVFGIARENKLRNAHVVTTVMEHPSVLECFKALEKRGVQVSYLKTDEKGYICLNELKNVIKSNTILVSVVHVCSETGTVQRIREIGQSIKEINNNTIFHVDGVQSFGKYKIDLNNSKIDLFSFSSHKIHGIKGIGCLYVKNGIHITPALYGGAQQRGVRPGTENTAAIAAFTAAAQAAYADMDKNFIKVSEIRNKLLEINDFTQININGDYSNGSPYILNISFIGFTGEVILNALSNEGIYVSTGSACNERRKKENALLRMGLSKERADSAVRFSFSYLNSLSDAEVCLDVLKKVLPLIRIK